MRRPTSALAKALIGTALAATTVSAQQTPPATDPGAAAAGAAGALSPMNPARGARHLLRNGWDYITYQEYERALAFFREAEARKVELTQPEQLRLTQGIERAQRGLREQQSGMKTELAYARSGRTVRPGAIAMATPAATPAPAPGIPQGPAPQFEKEPIQLAQATSDARPNAANVRAGGEPTAAAPAPAISTPAPLPAIPDVESLPLPPLGTETPAPAAAKPAAAPEPLPAAEAAAAPTPLPTLPSAPEPAPAAAAPAPAPLAETQPVAAPAAAPAPAGEVKLPPPPDVELPTLPPNLPAAPVELQNAAAAAAAASAAPAPGPASTPTPAPAPAPAAAPVAMIAAAGETPSAPPSVPPAMPPAPEVAPPAALPTEAPATPTDSPAAPLTTPAPVAEAPAVPDALPTLPSAPAEAAAPAPAAAPAAAVEVPGAPLPTTPPVEPPPAPPAESLPNPGATPPAPMAASETPRETKPTPDSFIPSRHESGPSTLSPELRREVEIIAQKQEEELRARAAQPPADTNGPAQGSPASTRLEISRAPSPTEARPIRAIPVPEEFVPLPKRDWNPNRKYWAAAAPCHMPLYFQDAALERYGYSMEQRFGTAGRYLSIPLDDPKHSKQRNQIIQPFFSAGLFAAQIVLLPYNMIMDPPWEAEYDLGYYRPGDQVPTDVYYLPFTGVGPPLRGANYGKPPVANSSPRW